VDDAVVRAMVLLEVPDPVLTELLPPVADRLGEGLGRAVRCREELPVLLAGLDLDR
jgi:hypothetical protein